MEAWLQNLKITYLEIYNFDTPENNRIKEYYLTKISDILQYIHIRIT